jgi:hypothetical protein
VFRFFPFAKAKLVSVPVLPVDHFGRYRPDLRFRFFQLILPFATRPLHGSDAFLLRVPVLPVDFALCDPAPRPIVTGASFRFFQLILPFATPLSASYGRSSGPSNLNIASAFRFFQLILPFATPRKEHDHECWQVVPVLPVDFALCDHGESMT